MREFEKARDPVQTVNRNLKRLTAMVQILLDRGEAADLNLAFGTPAPAGTSTGGTRMAQQLGDSEQITATIAPKDRAGNPAAVEAGSVVWVSSDETITTVAADPANEASALITAVGPLGTASITVSADADLGEGVITITDTADVEIVAGQAANLGLGFGAPTPKP